MNKRQVSPTIALRLSKDEKVVLDAYARAANKKRSTILHELIKKALPELAGTAIRQQMKEFDAEMKRQDAELAELSERYAENKAKYGKPEQSPAST
jgi:predicted transcriptional regulator